MQIVFAALPILFVMAWTALTIKEKWPVAKIVFVILAFLIGAVCPYVFEGRRLYSHHYYLVDIFCVGVVLAVGIYRLIKKKKSKQPVSAGEKWMYAAYGVLIIADIVRIVYFSMLLLISATFFDLHH
ncbi:MAG: hypothetical protein IJU16_05265 [Clostridia bacterium]|nr:hypothetical protein [Clostridia bacterium]